MSVLTALMVKIGADSSGLRKELKATKKDIDRTFSRDPVSGFEEALTGTASKVSSLITKFNTAAVLAGGGFGLTALISSAVSAGDSIKDLSEKLRISTADAEMFSRTVKLAGGDVDTASGAMMRLDSTITGSGEKAEKTRAILDSLGVSLTDHNGKLLPLNEQLKNLAQGYQAASDAGYGQEFIMNTLGVRGMALTETLMKYNEAAEDAARIKGIGLDPEQMSDINRQLKITEAQLEQLTMAGGALLAPIVGEYLPAITQGLADTAGLIAGNREEIVSLGTSLAQLAVTYKVLQAIAKAGGLTGSAVTAAAEVEALSKAQEAAITRRLNMLKAAQKKEEQLMAKEVAARKITEAEKEKAITESCMRIQMKYAETSARIEAEMRAAYRKMNAEAKMSAAGQVQAIATTGAAAKAAGAQMVTASAAAKGAVGSLTKSVWALVGGWYFTKNVSYKLDNTWVTDTANGTDTRGLRFEIEFPNGLCHISDSGKVENATVNLDIEYRKVTTDTNDNVTYGAWTNLFKELASNSYGVTLAKNVAAGSYTMKIQCLWDDDEDGYRSWFYNVRISIGSYSGTIRKKDIGSKVVTVGAFRVDTDKWSDSLVSSVKNGNDKTATLTVSNGSGNGIITAARNSALRKQFTVNHIPSGEYEVRVKVSYRQYAETNTQASSTCYLTAITSIIYDDFTYPCTALLGISAVATDQLNGSPSLSFLKERTYVYVWNGSSYVKKRADNPAWASYDLLHQARRLKNINTGNWEYEVRGAPADRIRYSDFAAWANWCNEKDLTVNIEINTSGEVLEVINQRIAPVGRGMVVRFGTKYGCIYDHVQQPVQMFNMGNILSGSFSEEFLKVADRANCVEVTFTNADADYQRDVLTIYGSTFDSDGYAKTAQLTMDGITDYKQAYREGKYHLMCNRYQLRTVSFEAGIDAIACTVGDVILVAHDVPKWANSGRIESVDDLTMVLPVYISDTTKSYRIQYRTVKDNLYTIPCNIIETSSDGWTTIGLVSEYSESDPPQAGDVFDLAIANIGSKPFVVKSITRAQDFTRRITGIEYAEALFEENYEIPPIQYATRAVGKAKNVTGLSAKQFQYTDENRVRHGMMSVSWKRASGGGRYTVLISTDKKKWTNVTETSNTFAEFNVKAKTDYYVKVVTILGISQSLGVVTGLISCGQDNPPKAVTGLSYKVDPADRTKAELTWNANTDIDLRNYKVAVSDGKTYTTASDIITIISSAERPTVTVYAVDNAGNQSAGTSIVVPVYPFPSNVTGFAVRQQTTDRSVLEFTWDAVTDSDLSQYELRIGATWATATQFARTKTRKTTYQISTSGTYTFWIAAINAAENYSQTPVKLARVFNIVPDAVTNLAVTQSTRDHSKAVVTFTASPGEDIAKYQIRYGATWDNGTLIGETSETRFEWQVPASGTYNVMVRAVTVAEQVSAVTNASITITIEPLDVTGFTATQSGANKTLIRLSWDPVPYVDISYYELRQGGSWETAAVIAPRVSGTTYDVEIGAEQIHTWLIKAVTIAGNKSQYAASVSEIFNLNPTAVETIQLRQNPNDRSELQIQWTPVPDGDLVGYQVKIGDIWESAEDLPLTNEVYATYTLPASGNYHVMIKTLNSAGYYSDETSESLRCKVEPTNATNFIAYQNGESVELYWTKSVDADVVGYEIREGASFRTGALVSTGIPNNYLSVKVDIERLFQYHIAAINRAGFVSSDAVCARLLVENLPPRNVILTFDEIARQDGSHDHTVFGESLINFQTVGGKFDDYDTTRWTDLGGQNVLKLAMDGDVYYESGVYTLQQIDVGKVITAEFSAYFVSTASGYASGVTAILQFRTSLDGVNWIDWADFKPVQRRFRYAEFKVVMATQDTARTPEVNHLTISVDVPDTDIAITHAIDQGGTIVPYGHEFYEVPNVTASAIGDMLHAVVVSRNRTECVIKVMNHNNTDVGGTADVKIKGF